MPVAHRVPEVYRWLAANPAGAVAEVPVHGEGLVREETLEMYFSDVSTGSRSSTATPRTRRS